MKKVTVGVCFGFGVSVGVGLGDGFEFGVGFGDAGLGNVVVDDGGRHAEGGAFERLDRILV